MYGSSDFRTGYRCSCSQATWPLLRRAHDERHGSYDRVFAKTPAVGGLKQFVNDRAGSFAPVYGSSDFHTGHRCSCSPATWPLLRRAPDGSHGPPGRVLAKSPSVGGLGQFFADRAESCAPVYGSFDFRTSHLCSCSPAAWLLFRRVPDGRHGSPDGFLAKIPDVRPLLIYSRRLPSTRDPPFSPERHPRFYTHPFRGNRQDSLSEFPAHIFSSLEPYCSTMPTRRGACPAVGGLGPFVTDRAESCPRVRAL